MMQPSSMRDSREPGRTASILIASWKITSSASLLNCCDSTTCFSGSWCQCEPPEKARGGGASTARLGAPRTPGAGCFLCLAFKT